MLPARARSLTALLCAAAALALLWSAPAVAAGPFGGTVRALVLTADAGAPAWAATDRGLFRHQGGSWQRIEALGSADLIAVQQVGPAELLVVPRTGAPLRSADDGKQWAAASQGLRDTYGRPVDEVLSLAADPVDPRQLLLGTAGRGVFASSDGGLSWQDRSTGLEQHAPPARHASTLLAAAKGRPGLLGTRGLGVFGWQEETWQPWGKGLPEGLQVTDLAAAPADPRFLALGSRANGLWQSHDAGQSWKQLRRGRFGFVGAVSVGHDGSVLAHFREEGLVRVAEGVVGRPAGPRTPWAECLVALRGGGWLAGLQHDGVLRVGADGLPGGSLVDGLAATHVAALVQGTQPEALWAGDANGVFFSADGGSTWEPRDAGLLGAAAGQFVWQGGSLYLGVLGQGVFRWEPAEQVWQRRSGGMGTANTIFSLVGDADGARLYAGTEGGVLRSDDGGGTWERKNRALPAANVWRLAASTQTAGRLWAAGGEQVFRSDDAGESWREVARARRARLAVEPNGDGERVWVLTSAQVLELGAAGGSPRLEAPRNERFQCLLPGGDTLWVGSSAGLWAVGRDGSRRVWDGTGLLSLLRLPDGSLQAGTDGRGVLSIRSARK